MLSDQNKGKIIIYLESENGKLNSEMKRTGLGRKTEVALTTLLVNFASLSIEKGKNPMKLIEEHFENIMEMLQKGKKIHNKAADRSSRRR